MARPRGYSLAPHMLPMCRALEDERIQNLMIIVGPGAGKALAPNTPVVTPGGSTAIKYLKPGDLVVSPAGGTTTVLAVWPQPRGPMYELTFADGRIVRANGKHLWTVYQKKFRLRGEGMKWRERTTEELANYLQADRAMRWYVPLTVPVERPEHALPIAPYTLGAVLGDGSVGPNGFCSFTSFDGDILARIYAEQVAVGGDITYHNAEAGGHFGLTGLGKAITRLGLAHSRSWDKFIPAAYKNGSVAQRWALLQGLFDTDGTVDEKSCVSYCTTSLQLAKDVQEVVWSLGGMCYVGTKMPVCTYLGEKRQGKRAYILSVRHPEPHKFFHLGRKKDRAIGTQYSDDLKLEITGIRNVDEGESVCISVAAEDGLFLCADYVVTHNSWLLSVVYPAWRLGKNPATTILGVSAGENLIQGFMHGVMEMVEYSTRYRQFFPGTQPDKGAGWSTERGLFVTGHELGDPDASYWGAGLDSKSLGGKHARELLFDDLHDDANSSTTDQCLKVRTRYYNTLMGRADPRGARRVLAGRRWNEQDLYGHFSDTGDWVVMTLPAERPNSRAALYIDIQVPKDLECCFTDTLLPEPVQPRDARHVNYRAVYGVDPKGQGFYWPAMEEKRKEYFDTKRNSPAVAQAVYQCDPGARKGAVFTKEDFVYYGAPDGLPDGIRNPEVLSWITEKGGSIVQVWDTATGQSTSSAFSVGMTLMLVPSNQWHRGEDPEWFGEAESHYLVYVLHVLREKLDFGNLSSAVRKLHRLWRPRVVLVENKSSGISLLQTLRGSNINVKGVKAVEGKVERAIDAVGGASGSAQGWVQQGRTLFPYGATWLDAFEAELVDFTSDSTGKKDQVDAFVHGVNYAILQGGKGITLPSDGARDQPRDPAAQLPADDIRTQMFRGFPTLFGDVQDPFADRCGGDHPCYYWKLQGPTARGSWCRFHSRVVSALDSCDHRRDLADTDHEEATYG